MVTTLQIHNDKDNKDGDGKWADNDNDDTMMRAKEQILLSPVDSTLNAAVVDQDMYWVSMKPDMIIPVVYMNTCEKLIWNGIYADMTAGHAHFIIYKLNILSKSQSIILHLKNQCATCLVWMQFGFKW